MQLSICVITKNRADQLIEALESCMECNLPPKTEFVILDNASTDNTENSVQEFKNKHTKHNVNYYYSSENLGVGGGRAKAFELAKGDVVYFLDDDAVISPKSQDDFFIKSLDFFEKNPKIASITTNIYDELLKYDRDIPEAKIKISGMPITFIYLGTSHFLRKEYFNTPLYFNIKYGSEEYYPSIIVQDKGYYNLFNKDLCVLHKPKVNKWVAGTDSMKDVLINGAANVYATKKILYPIVFRPVIWAGYKARCYKYLKDYSGAIKAADNAVKILIKQNKNIKRIKISTVIKLYKQFGFSAF